MEGEVSEVSPTMAARGGAGAGAGAGDADEEPKGAGCLLSL